ncbi:MAG: pyruvate/oxaloacetate carboxyltransferase [Thermodesulfovibrionales bacterium]|nr:pyruvate/oxaloacetate carboxyltransferase [Thermodesulfovibrionales bacterium]
MATKQIKIMDTTFRDAHQSLIATRMRLDDLLPIAEKMDSVGFWSIEVWGGATFDSCLRYLNEDPWDRLKEFKKVIKKTPLQMLIRGQCLVGYRHYADDLVERFIAKAIEYGINIVRIFDALNDFRNIETSVKSTLKYGGKVEIAICYTYGPVYSIDFFVDLAKRAEELGAHTICIEDMAGILTPLYVSELLQKIKQKVSVPTHLHTHDTCGMAVATTLKAIEAGVDIVDTAISSMASGASQPAVETICNALRGTPSDPKFDIKLLRDISSYFKRIRKKYKSFESEHTTVNPDAMIYQLPGGMISNLDNQLREQNALDKFDKVLEEILYVRQDFGYPPLITPISQIVGTQATLNVINDERYKITTIETKNYLKGLYGTPPAQINEDIRKKILGDEVFITCRPADTLKPEIENAKKELGNKALRDTDIISYALFPKLFLNYLENKEKGISTEEISEKQSIQVQPTKEETPQTQPNLVPSEFIISVHGESYNIKVAGIGHKSEGKKPYFLYVDDHLVEVFVEPLVEVLPSESGIIDFKDTKQSKRPKALSIGDITTAMPGRIAKILVKKGDLVKAGDAVLVVEAMKMENEIHTTIDGKVEEIFVSVGDSVNPDEALIRIV